MSADPRSTAPTLADDLARLDDRLLFDQVTDAVIVTDLAFRIQRWNAGAAQLYGWPAADSIGQSMSALVPVVRYVGAETAETARVALQAHQRWSGTVVQRHRDGTERLVEASLRYVQDAAGRAIGVIAINRDVSARLDLAAATHRLAVLAAASHAFAAASLDLQAVLEQITRHMAETIGDVCAIRLIAADGASLLPGTSYHPDPAARAFVQAMLADAPQRLGEGLSGRVAATGMPLLLPAITPEQLRPLVKPEYWPYIARFGVHAGIIVLLRVQDRIIGALNMVRDRTPGPYTADDLALVQELADRAALAISNATFYAQAQHELADRTRAEQALRAQSTRLSVLVEASRAFAAAGLDSQAVIQQVVRQIAAQLAALGILRLRSADHALLETVAMYDADAAYQAAMEQAGIGRSLTTRPPVPLVSS